MYAKERLELLGMLRQVVTRLEQGLTVESSVSPVCETCGHTLSCLRCAGRKGWARQKGKVSHEQHQTWGKLGGRPRKRNAMIVDSVTGAAVPLTTKASAHVAAIQADAPPPHESVIDPVKYYRPEEAAPLLGVRLNTMRHWRTAKRGPAYHKLDGHFVRYSGKDLLDWLSGSRHSALTQESDSDGARKAEPNL
jgi:hypothetical protein